MENGKNEEKVKRELVDNHLHIVIVVFCLRPPSSSFLGREDFLLPNIRENIARESFRGREEGGQMAKKSRRMDGKKKKKKKRMKQQKKVKK